MSVCSCSCVFGADFEQICIAEIEILCVKSLVFYASIVKTLSLIAVYEHYMRKSFSESSQICGQAKTTQFNFIVIVNIYSSGKIFIQSSTLHK